MHDEATKQILPFLDADTLLRICEAKQYFAIWAILWHRSTPDKVVQWILQHGFKPHLRAAACFRLGDAERLSSYNAEIRWLNSELLEMLPVMSTEALCRVLTEDAPEPWADNSLNEAIRCEIGKRGLIDILGE